MSRLILMILIAPLFVSVKGLAQTTKAEKLEQLRRALRGGQSSSDHSKASHPSVSDTEPSDMRNKALDELRPKEASYSVENTPNLAIVRTQNIEAKDPVSYKRLQVGLTAQPYAAKGSAPLVLIGDRDLSQSDSTWMFGAEARYMPWNSHLVGEHLVGLRFSAAYARQSLNLVAPTGVGLSNSRIHALQTSLLLSQEWVAPWSNAWSLNFDAGVSRFDLLLTSSSTLGEASSDIWLSTFRIGPSYRFGRLSLNFTYERRDRMTHGWARYEENGFLLGMMYDGLR